MKLKEVFTISTMPSQSIGGLTPFLTRDDCVVESKTKNENALKLLMKRAGDGEEGLVYVRVRPEFQELAEPLLARAFANAQMIGLTLEQLDGLDTDIEIESSGRRLSLKN